LPAKGLDGTLSLVGAFLSRWNAFHFNALLQKETQERGGAFVVQDLELDLMAKFLDKLICERKGCAEAGFSARGERM
jgi:hypothetical protein